MESQEDSDHMDAVYESSGAAEVSPRLDYYDQRRARFMAAVKGRLPISDYVQEVVAEVDHRYPPLPSA